jgi:hypothetical protein
MCGPFFKSMFRKWELCSSLSHRKVYVQYPSLVFHSFCFPFFIFSPLFYLSFLPMCGCYKSSSFSSFGTFSSVVLTTPADVVLERMGAQCVLNGNWQLPHRTVA